MKIYKYLADHYEYIFPSKMKINFLSEEFVKGGKLLDVGCSDGRVAKGLSDKGFRIEAIDLSEDMIRVAKKVSRNEKDFKVSLMDMSKVDKHFSPNTFNGVYCIGNTLVHLKDYDLIEDTLIKFKKLLKPKGKLVIQILNYDFIYNKDIRELPLIDNEKLTFKRFYILEEKKVTFKINLKIKDTKEEGEGDTILFPIRKNQLERALEKAGFSSFDYYGGFDGKEYSIETMPLVVVAQ